MNHPDEEVQRAAADPNAGGVELQDQQVCECDPATLFRFFQFIYLRSAGNEAAKGGAE